MPHLLRTGPRFCGSIYMFASFSRFVLYYPSFHRPFFKGIISSVLFKQLMICANRYPLVLLKQDHADCTKSYCSKTLLFKFKFAKQLKLL